MELCAKPDFRIETTIASKSLRDKDSIDFWISRWFEMLWK